jgi:hypothetical protein
MKEPNELQKSLIEKLLTINNNYYTLYDEPYVDSVTGACLVEFKCIGGHHEFTIEANGDAYGHPSVKKIAEEIGCNWK